MPKTVQEAHLDTLDVYDASGFENFLDPASCPRALLGFLAYWLDDLTYTTILGEEYERRSVADSALINSWVGTEAAINRFAENADILHTIQYERGGSPEALQKIIICVNEHTREIEGELIDFLAFLERTYKDLLWQSVTVQIDICPSFDLQIGYVGAVQATAFYVSEG